ncbi:MAG: hypothetical protein J5935_02905 [Lachnospiraceae bacterium]|nr:hypothetical protein [Lachnospiraceae bacterium]
MNNAFPVFRDNEVIGAVVFDLDQEHVDRELHRNTAKELGLMRQSLQYRMKKFGLGRMSDESGL